MGNSQDLDSGYLSPFFLLLEFSKINYTKSLNLFMFKKSFKLRNVVAIATCLAVTTMFSGCNDDVENPNNPQNPTFTETGLYMGIIGFNDDVLVKDIGLLNADTRQSFNNFIDNMTMLNNTALYHAVYTAIDRIQQATFPNDLINVSIVTFTDGLDNISHRLNTSYQSEGQYRAAVNNRIRNVRIQNLPISAYAIGLLGRTGGGGADVMSASLNSLASNANNVRMSADMNDINAEFARIADLLHRENRSLSASIVFPPPFFGSRVRFVFNPVSNIENSTIYIEGVYSAGDVLTNIVYRGLRSSSGTNVQAVRDPNSNSYVLTFNNLELESGGNVSLNNLTMWRRGATATQWIHEVEFDPNASTITEVERASSVIMLVLDCSSSLGTADFARMKTAAKNFINVLVSGSSGGGSGGNSGGGSNEGVVINGVRWATRNVDAPGTFAQTPESSGMLYQWNRRAGWVSTGNVSGWNGSPIAGNSWGSTNDPCPQSWRVPTVGELQTLTNTNSVTSQWATVSGVNGRRFTDRTSGNYIFLPAVGWREINNGVLNQAGSFGGYWSSTAGGAALNARGLFFGNSSVLVRDDQRVHAFSVRCVAE